MNEAIIKMMEFTGERSQFIRRTYAHLAGAVLLFVGLEAALLNSPLAKPMMDFMTTGKYSWLIVLGLFMGASWLAQSWAQSNTSLAVYVEC